RHAQMTRTPPDPTLGVSPHSAASRTVQAEPQATPRDVARGTDPRDVARLFDGMAGIYHELEPWYEHLYAVLHALVREHVRRAHAGARALDAGCGTGFQTAILDTLAYESHGLDLSAALLRVAARTLARPRLCRGNVEALPYPSATFDAVVCCGSTLSFT